MLRSELSFYLNANIWLVKSFIWGFHAISQKNPNKLCESIVYPGKFQEIVKDGKFAMLQFWGLERSQTRLGHWTTAVVYTIKPLPRETVFIVKPAVTKQGKKMRGANFKGFLLSPPVPLSSQDTEASFSKLPCYHHPHSRARIYNLWPESQSLFMY